MSRAILFTGMSGAGKTTLATGIAKRVRGAFDAVYLLDGDVTRQHLYPDLGYTREDRQENLDRAAWLANYLAQGSDNILVLLAYIAPYPEVRKRIRQAIHCDFTTVFLTTPLEVLKQRDPKGLYAKAMRGEIERFTGISDPYIPPEFPDLVINTSDLSIKESMHILEDFFQVDRVPGAR